MRQNLPVTGREYVIADGMTLMSTTDTQSYLRYANEAFIEASGFERDELMGQPHNVVRHPDMPVEAFADLWATLKAGQSWTALIKNRRKNGDHYWVRANATPVRRDGHVTGYMSVRTKPGRDEVERAEALYRAFREGKAGRRRFHRGLIVRTGPMAWASALQLLPVRWRIRGAVALALPLLAGAAAACGVGGVALGGFALAAAVLLGLISAVLEAQIARPLATVLQQALAVAAGQPADHADLGRVDEIGLILRAVNQAGLNLLSLVDDVGGQMAGLKGAAGEIRQGNADLSARTEQAASSLQQTAASMEQMSASVRQNSDSARQAAALAGEASRAAAHGGEVVTRVVDTMQQISAASRRIADIIGTVDGIAFQTNILALNAAVEAARAGEQGRGFAVVAGEVRSLARRSAEAAKEIKSLIGDSVEKVDGGTRLVDDAGRTMQGIVAQARQVAGLIEAISAATVEQGTGIGEVSAAVTQLDRVTQQNAALVEQSSAASAGMAARAARLDEAVAVYRAGT